MSCGTSNQPYFLCSCLWKNTFKDTADKEYNHGMSVHYLLLCSKADNKTRLKTYNFVSHEFIEMRHQCHEFTNIRV